MALVVGVGLFPADPLKLIWSAEGSVLRSLLRILERRAAPAGEGADPEMGWALAASHEVHARLSALTQARATARASVRVAPRRMPMRRLVEMEERRVARLYLLASAVLGLMRTAMDVSGRRVEPDPACAAEMEQLADGLRSLLQAPRPWPEPTLRQIDAQMRTLLEQPLPDSTPESAVLTTAARRVAAGRGPPAAGRAGVGVG